MLRHQEQPVARQLSFVTTLLNNWYCHGPANGEALINVLKYDPLLCKCFEQSIQDFENQSLEAHTLRVIDNFLTRFNGKQSFFECNKDFLLLLALHDIGKPAAFAAGDRNLQGPKSLEIIDQLTAIFPVSSTVLNKIKIIINGDIIGSYLNPFYAESLERTISKYRKTCFNLRMPHRLFWPALVTYYQCDASAYRNLRNKVFVFRADGHAEYDSTGTRLLFQPEQEKMFLKLEKAVSITEY